MSGWTWLRRAAGARALVVTVRQMYNSPSRTANVECEELLSELDQVDLLSVQERPAHPRWQGFASRARRVLPVTRALSLGHTPPPGEWDVLFFGCQQATDVYALGSLRTWRSRCRTLVAWIDELWAQDVSRMVVEMELFREFDHIFLGCFGSIAAVAAATGRAVHYGAPAVDMLRFSPWPDPPQRCIDVYNMGRRSKATHQELLRLSAERRMFYLHDTLASPGLETLDMVEHRAQLARIVKRTRFFLASKAKVNEPDQTRGQEEVGFRFFEGAAGGTVLLGTAPSCPTFATHFGWEDSVIPLPFGSTEIGAVMAMIESDPAREEAIRRRNVAEMLRRHDWAHRWAEIGEIIGLAPLPALQARRSRLQALASQVWPTASSPAPTGALPERGAPS